MEKDHNKDNKRAQQAPSLNGPETRMGMGTADWNCGVGMGMGMGMDRATTLNQTRSARTYAFVAKRTKMNEALNHRNRLIRPLDGCSAACQIKTLSDINLRPNTTAINIFNALCSVIK